MLGDAYGGTQSKMEEQRVYCKIVLHYADLGLLEEKYVQSCKDWWKAYEKYLEEFRIYEEQIKELKRKEQERIEELVRLQEKAEEQRMEQIRNAPVNGNTKDHILRRS